MNRLDYITEQIKYIKLNKNMSSDNKYDNEIIYCLYIYEDDEEI